MLSLSSAVVVVAAVVRAIAAAVAAAPGPTDVPLVASAGSTAAISGWYMQSSARASQNMVTLSQPGVDVSTWYRVGSHSTVMVCVLAEASCP